MYPVWPAECSASLNRLTPVSRAPCSVAQTFPLLAAHICERTIAFLLQFPHEVRTNLGLCLQQTARTQWSNFLSFSPFQPQLTQEAGRDLSQNSWSGWWVSGDLGAERGRHMNHNHRRTFVSLIFPQRPHTGSTSNHSQWRRQSPLRFSFVFLVTGGPCSPIVPG